jgi:hypothetical protein
MPRRPPPPDPINPLNHSWEKNLQERAQRLGRLWVEFARLVSDYGEEEARRMWLATIRRPAHRPQKTTMTKQDEELLLMFDALKPDGPWTAARLLDQAYPGRFGSTAESIAMRISRLRPDLAAVLERAGRRRS